MSPRSERPSGELPALTAAYTFGNSLKGHNPSSFSWRQTMRQLRATMSAGFSTFTCCRSNASIAQGTLEDQ